MRNQTTKFSIFCKRICCLVLFVLVAAGLRAQTIYVSESFGIYRLNLENCLYELVIETPGTVSFDLAFHPDGKLYGINGTGEFYEIDTLTGGIQILHQFDGVLFQALTISKEGVAYTCDRDGTFWSYDLATGIATNHGNTGFNVAGDMAFYNGELYMTAPEFDYIVKVDIANPANSTIVMEDAGTDGGAMYGIVTHALDCNDVKLYGMVAGNKTIHEIDLEAQTTDTLCFLDDRFNGAATRHEFKQSDPIRITDTIITHPECGLLNGSISITTIGGAPGYRYSLNGDPFQNENSFVGLSEGDYLILVEDTRGCTTEIEVTLLLQEVDLIDTLQVVDATCGQDNGIVVVSPIAGHQVMYSLDEINYQVEALFDELSPGVYEITARNDAGCVETQTVEINLVPQISVAADITPTSCGLDNGELLMYAINGSPIQSSLFGVDYGENHFTAIPAGPITIFTIDLDNCIVEHMFDIPLSQPLVLDAVEIHHPTCAEENGTLTLHISNSTGLVMYSLDQFPSQTSPVFQQLGEGDYNWSAVDEAGCSVEGSVHIPSSTAFTIESLLIQKADCGKSNGVITIELSLPTANVTSTINGIQNENSGLISSLSAGVYEIVFTDDQGCSTDTSIVIPQNACELYIANVFSPNGDGINDFIQLQLPNTEGFFIKQFLVFDRWGNVLQEIVDKPLTNPFVLWDGRVSTEEAQSGVYTYILVIEEQGEMLEYKGDVTLIR